MKYIVYYVPNEDAYSKKGVGLLFCHDSGGVIEGGSQSRKYGSLSSLSGVVSDTHTKTDGISVEVTIISFSKVKIWPFLTHQNC